MDILMLKEGKDKIKDRLYSSKYLQNSNLVIECKIPSSSFMRLVVVTQLQGSMERENYKQCNCSTTVNTCICIPNMYTNVIAPAYLYDIITFFVLFFDDVYCFGINAPLASTVLAQSSTTQASSDTFAFFSHGLYCIHKQLETLF
ncbi:hypothetical protein AVEN_13554-1 [Araneus ventricosus]|uniref:Uncharacterized protein n=1 Tax=Araneus ventricosus TaxID=182803 RepID=A0A4Y2D6W6_ARAVE|nr:hypothetical protein AVEN_13554-1 [Araneus ventricosus]